MLNSIHVSVDLELLQGISMYVCSLFNTWPINNKPWRQQTLRNRREEKKLDSVHCANNRRDCCGLLSFHFYRKHCKTLIKIYHLASKFSYSYLNLSIQLHLSPSLSQSLRFAAISMLLYASILLFTKIIGHFTL